MSRTARRGARWLCFAYGMIVSRMCWFGAWRERTRLILRSSCARIAIFSMMPTVDRVIRRCEMLSVDGYVRILIAFMTLS